MLNRNRLRPIGFVSAMSLLCCALTSTAQDQSVMAAMQPTILESLTLDAYQRIVPRLSGLKAGDPIQSKIEWHVYPILDKQGNRKHVFGVSEGWVGPLSGGLWGSLSGFGNLAGRTGDLLLGEHVFGYLVGGTRLMPQYVVTTQATVIPREEYERLRKEKNDDVGFMLAAGDRFSFKGLTVKEVRQLTFPNTALKGKGQTLADLARSHATTERFGAAENKLKSLSQGTAFWDVMIALDMTFWTLDSGVSYKGWIADGYLGEAWSVLTDAGYFNVLRFGYLDGDNEVPKLVLIFKNNRVHKMAPFGTRYEITRHFD